MNSSVEPAIFECPDGFSKEDAKSQLFYEDLDDDSELWLIRAPIDMEPTVIENQCMTLSGESQVNIVDGSDGASYEYFVEKCAMPNLCLVLPHKEDKNLEVVKNSFQGSILFSNCVMPNVNTNIKVEENGLGNEANLNVFEEENGDASVRKKSKIKSENGNKTNQWESELNTLSDPYLDTDPTSSSQKKLSKKHKKKSKDIDFVKEESLLDLDEFPNCTSQKT